MRSVLTAAETKPPVLEVAFPEYAAELAITVFKYVFNVLLLAELTFGETAPVTVVFVVAVVPMLGAYIEPVDAPVVPKPGIYVPAGNTELLTVEPVLATVETFDVLEVFGVQI